MGILNQGNVRPMEHASIRLVGNCLGGGEVRLQVGVRRLDLFVEGKGTGSIFDFLGSHAGWYEPARSAAPPTFAFTASTRRKCRRGELDGSSDFQSGSCGPT